MQQPSKLQIADLEPNQSDIEQEITHEEAAKIIGGKNDKYKLRNNFPLDQLLNELPFDDPPCPPNQPCRAAS